jgi:hypothetical protein
LVVGWGGYAEYRVEVLPRPRAEATVGSISEADAASAFIFSVLPLVLPLFGLEPFHGSAVGVRGGALLVLGAAGTGKSSTAAAMEAGGFDLLADDASAIDGRGHLWPGPPALNPRWGDAQQRVVWKYNAKDVRAPERHTTAPQPVVAALILTPQQGAPVQIRPLGGQETLVSVLANVRAPEVLATRRRELQLRLGAVLSAMPAAAISFDPAQQPFEQIAEVASEWVLRASSWAADQPDSFRSRLSRDTGAATIGPQGLAGRLRSWCMPRNFVIDRGGSVYLASALRTLWTYRAIILAFAERNIRVKYKQSALGIA